MGQTSPPTSWQWQDLESAFYPLKRPDFRCTLTCLDGHPGGYLKCEETGSYEDNTWCDPPTQFDDC